MIILLIAMMTALLYAAGLVDKRIARLFTYDYARLFTGGEEFVYSFASRLAYAEEADLLGRRLSGVRPAPCPRRGFG